MFNCHIVATLLDSVDLEHFHNCRQFYWMALFQAIRSLRFLKKEWEFLSDQSPQLWNGKCGAEKQLGFIHIDGRMGLLKERSRAPHIRRNTKGEREGREENLDRIIIWSFTCKYLLYSSCMPSIVLSVGGVLVNKNELDFCCHRACSWWSFTGWTILKIQECPSLCAPHVLKCLIPTSWNWRLKWAKVLLKVGCISIVQSVFQLLREKWIGAS